MASAQSPMVCPACSQTLPAEHTGCPHCGVSAAWLELLQAHDFVARRFDKSLAHVTGFLERRRQKWVQAAKAGESVPQDTYLPASGTCWRCAKRSPKESIYCSCGVPITGPKVQSIRFLEFLMGEVQVHQRNGSISLTTAHGLLSQTREQIGALKHRLGQEAVSPREEVLAAESVKPDTPAGPRRSLLEILVDPRSIQWLLASGAALLVLGLVIYLWAVGVFQNPTVVAVGLGLGNAALLAGGWTAIKLTRFQTAGRALTLLACLVMPLNLWFYHANELITFEGQLWLPALVMCGLYAASAVVLRDELFVYVVVGGVAMTGLLILADRNVDQFWQIAAPSTMLVILGLISLHAERAFPEGEGPFSRSRFGLALFWSGHALLGAGLLLVLGAQVAGGWLYEPVFRTFYERLGAGQPWIVTEFWSQLQALALVLAGTYAYLYSDLVVRRVGIYVYIGIFTLLWAEILAINLFDWAIAMELVIAALAVTALAANLLQVFVMKGEGTLSRTGPPLGLFLSTVPVLLGLVLHLRATNQDLFHSWQYQVGWGYVAAMLGTAISCRIGAFLFRHTIPWLSAVYFFGTAASTMIGAAGLLAVLGVEAWSIQAALLMVIPIIYLIASRLYGEHAAAKPLLWVGYAATLIMVLSVVAGTLNLTHQVLSVETKQHLWLGLFFTEAAIFFALATVWRQEGLDIYLATAAACGAVWQFLLPWTVAHPEYYTLAFALLGFALLVLYRLAILERFEKPALANAAFQCANALMSLALVAAALLTLTWLAPPSARAGAVRQMDYSLVTLLITLTSLSLLAAWLVQHQAWRRWYVVTAIAEALLTFVVLHVLSGLTIWQKLEIFCLVVGLALLAVGHYGWYREQDQQRDLVSLSLGLGTLLAALPLAIAVVYYRAGKQLHTLDELGLLVVGLFLFASGFACRLQATTIGGAGMLTTYVATMILLLRLPEKLETMGFWLAVGGGSLFGLGIVLSIYRDRLLALPDKIKRREGIFRVLSWR